MSFQKKTWANGEVIYADDLNRMEEGIAAANEEKEQDGGDVVGISSIKQTTTSNEDGGTNVWTAELTDGTKSTFKVKNGSKGSDGKTAYEYAKAGGYEGTEEEFADKLAEETPTKEEHTNLSKEVESLKTYVTPQMFGAKGDGVTDDTSAFNTALATSGRLFVPAGTYMINCESHEDNGTLYGIVVPSNREIVMDKNVILKQIESAEDRTYLFHLKEVSNVRISGGSIVGDRAETTDFTDMHGHNYGIRMDTCSNIFIDNMEIRDFVGDGIGMSIPTGTESAEIWNENIHINNVVIDNCWRNNVNVGQAKYVYINDSVFSNANGLSPQSGIDIEANDYENLINEYIYINNCKFHGNVERDIAFAIPCDNIIISNCVCKTGITSTRDTVTENIQIIDCELGTVNIHGEIYKGCKIGTAGIFSVGGKFYDCVIDYVSATEKYTGIEFNFVNTIIRSISMGTNNSSVVTFSNCIFIFSAGAKTMFYGEKVQLLNCRVLFDSTYTTSSTPVHGKNLIAIDTVFSMEANVKIEALLRFTTVKLVSSTFDIPNTVTGIVRSSTTTTIAIGCKFFNHTTVGNVSGADDIIHDNIFMGQKVEYLTAADLAAATADALAEAKESGEFDGENGTSVSVSSVTESTEDGGDNIVTFSDGKTLTVKNGKTGAAGKTPVKGTDYFTEAEKQEMVSAVCESLNSEIWSFELEDGTTVEKVVLLK